MAREISKASRGSDPGENQAPTINIRDDSISVSGFYDSGNWRIEAGVLKRNGVVVYRFTQQGDVAVEPGEYVHDVEGTMEGEGYISNEIEFNFA